MTTPALFGLSEGALVSALHAARNQDRVGSLVLYGGWASSLPTGDSPGVMPADVGEAFISGVAESWETVEDLLWIWAPEAAEDQRTRSWWAWRSIAPGSGNPTTVCKVESNW